jgi:tRNA(His) 5'-end guanylyltransferase
MLEYVKVILQKVSFDPRLFEKELKKSISYLKGREVEALREWCYHTFYNSERHAEVIEGCFELA